jgi:hypothetical protein
VSDTFHFEGAEIDEDVPFELDGVSAAEWAARTAEQSGPQVAGQRRKMTKKNIGYARTEDGLYYGIPGVADALEPGFYNAVHTNNGPAFKRLATKTDDLIDLEDEISAMLLGEVERFWASGKELRERGLSQKRGLLLYGPPGSGKTSIVHRVCAHGTQTLGGVVVFVDQAKMVAASLQLLRSVEPSRPVILLYEDIDAMMERGTESEAAILALLDGELQIGNVFHVATTNYPDKLDKRFTDRPGRFDRIARVPPPDAKSRAAYFNAKAKDAKDRHAKWIKASDGWSIAHLRELVIATLVLGEDDDKVIARLNEMKNKVWEKEDGESRLGFGAK